MSNEELMRRDITYIQGVQMEEAAEILRHSFFQDEQMQFVEREVRNNEELKQVFQEWLAYWKYERCLAEFHAFTKREMFYYYGNCAVCNSPQPFIVDYQFAEEDNGIKRPNWRERLVCPNCGCNNRQRFVVHKVFENYKSGMKVLLYEQTTQVYHMIQRDIPDVTGFEYAGVNVQEQTENEEIHFEDVCRLGYPDETFDIIVSNDVFSRADDYERAFQEAYRVLKPEGKMIFTVPFNGNSQENVKNTEIVVFGWDMLGDLKKCGFKEAYGKAYYGLKDGYLGYLPLYFEVYK